MAKALRENGEDGEWRWMSIGVNAELKFDSKNRNYRKSLLLLGVEYCLV